MLGSRGAVVGASGGGARGGTAGRATRRPCRFARAVDRARWEIWRGLGPAQRVSAAGSRGRDGTPVVGLAPLPPPTRVRRTPCARMPPNFGGVGMGMRGRSMERRVREIGWPGCALYMDSRSREAKNSSMLVGSMGVF